MRLDSLVRLVESSDFSSFREIALLCLVARGYEAPELTDGPDDGGKDFIVRRYPGSARHLAVQVSVERDWKPKLIADAHKAREKYTRGRRRMINSLLFVSSRRIPDVDFHGVQDELLGIGMHVSKLDSQGIASLAIERGFASKVLRCLNIDVSDVVPDAGVSPRQRIRQEAAYSYALFGEQSVDFKTGVIERAVLARVASDGESRRSDLEPGVTAALGLASTQQALVGGAVDRLIQRGALSVANGVIRPSEVVKDGQIAAAALRRKGQQELTKEVVKLLRGKVPRGTNMREAVDAVMAQIGGLVLASAGYATATVSHSNDSSAHQDRLKERLRALNAVLDTYSIAMAERRSAFLEELAALATASSYGKCVLAGEVFLSLLSVQTPHLLMALGSRADVRVILDATVAIPMLANLLFRPVRTRFSSAAKQLHDQIAAHRMPAVVPGQYLEEIATHLLEAYLDYKDVIELDADLKFSQNAFVAHYVGLRADGYDEGFVDYLSVYGFEEHVAKRDFYRARDGLMSHIGPLLGRYGLEVGEMGFASGLSMKRAEEQVSFGLRQIGDERPPVVLRHDVRVIAFLHDAVQKQMEYVLCTWDRLHHHIRKVDGPNWEVHNPIVLADILSWAMPTSAKLPMASPVFLALALDEAHAEKGAEVWDRIVRLERSQGMDGAVISEARKFKRAYLDRVRDAKAPGDIATEWARWKKERLPEAG